MLSGIETEYGLAIDGRGAEDQIEDAAALVRGFPDKRCFVGWDYFQESPRTDLRGFKKKKLSIDPVDAKFDSGRRPLASEEVRSDRILVNGARFYNDHGHPEYATPECWSLHELMLADKAGELVTVGVASAYEAQSGRRTRIYKNNLDGAGSSYGTHDSCLVPREVGFERLYQALTPLLATRWVLCGSGSVSPEDGRFLMSQRAGVFEDKASVDTLYRRPLFNTRDEPHADRSRWARLHVIAVDANLIGEATMRRVGLMRLAVRLAMADEAPEWELKDPCRAGQMVSSSVDQDINVDLKGRKTASAHQILESYLARAEEHLELSEEERWVIDSCRHLLEIRFSEFSEFARGVDWAAKLQILREFQEEEGIEWTHPMIASLNLAYHLIDDEEGLFPALVSLGRIEGEPDPSDVLSRIERPGELTRASARAAAVQRLSSDLLSASWGRVVLRSPSGPLSIELPPDIAYDERLFSVESTEEFADIVQECTR